jgi:DNA polymerase elongation subunit (family B)
MKILVIDIECSPNLAYVWGMFKQNVSLSQLESAGEVISFAAKWTDQKQILFYSVHHDGKEAMVQAAHDLLSEADVVVGYNSKNFDMKHLHKEFLLAGLEPPAPYKNIDLMHVVKANFRFTSNKLDFVVQQLGLGAKVHHTGFDLWKDCMAGSDKAWALMRKYNIGDIRVTEALYNKLLPWIGGHPSVPLHDGNRNDACQNCGSEDLRREGYAFTTLGKFQRIQCRDCGKWGRSGKRIEGVDIRGI